MALSKIFNAEQEKLLKIIIKGFVIFGKYNANNFNTFIMRVLIHFNKISNDEPLRMGFVDNYIQVKEKLECITKEVIKEINSLNLKEEFKIKERTSLITSGMMKDAEKAEFRHRKTLGNDY